MCADVLLFTAKDTLEVGKRGRANFRQNPGSEDNHQRLTDTLMTIEAAKSKGNNELLKLLERAKFFIEAAAK